MAVCEACEILNNQLKAVDPHASLVESTSSNWNRSSGGMAKGVVTRYKCSNCGTTMARDGDPSDPFAGWYIEKVG